VALVTVALASVSYLTIPSGRRQVWDILKKIRDGRQDGGRLHSGTSGG